MKEYMSGVFLISALFAILGRLSYKSGLDGVRKFAFGLIILSVTAAPVISVVREIDLSGGGVIPDFEEPDTQDSAIYENAFRVGIGDLVAEKFELRREDVRVLTEGFSVGEWRSEKIRIILSGRAVFSDYHKIEEYIEKLGIGECEAEIEIG